MGKYSVCSDEKSTASHDSLLGSGDDYCSLVAQREWWPLLRARNGASWVPYVVGERCMNVNRQANVFLPGPGSANTIVMCAPKWAVYALRVDFRDFKWT